MNRDAALADWFASGHEVFVAERDGRIVGTYYLRPNQQGGGAHVANCGYMTAPSAQGRGVGRAMCEHSLARAKAREFRAMQFNFVVSTNERAVNLWLCDLLLFRLGETTATLRRGQAALSLTV